MKFKLQKLKLTFRRMRIEGKKVVCWNVWRDRKHVAGGMCFSEKEARSDANIWMRDNLEYGDRVIFHREGRGPELVRIEVTLAEGMDCFLRGTIVFRHLYLKGRTLRIGPIRHRANPDELHLPERAMEYSRAMSPKEAAKYWRARTK